MRWLFDFGKEAFRRSQQDDVGGLAGELTYRLLLALFPFFIFLAALGGFGSDLLGIEDPTGEIMDALADTLPEDAASVLSDELESVLESRSPTLLTVGIAGAIWGASGAMMAFMKGMNRIYDAQESRPIVRRYALAIGLTVLAAAFIVGAFSALLAGQVFGEEIAEAIGLGRAAGTLIWLAEVPFIAGMLLAATAFLYWAAPNVDVPFRWITPGSLLFVIGWTVATLAFGLYVSNFGSYNATYGTLGGVVVLMLWLYMTSYIMLAGAEVNAVLQSRVAPETMEGSTLPGAPSDGQRAEERRRRSA